MPRRWVVNASPIIVLARLGHEDFLFQLASEVAIPQGVADEILAGPRDDRAYQLVRAGRFTVIQSPTIQPVLSAWDLGAGETEVLAAALARPGWSAVIDDRAARKCAVSFGIPSLGTLGIVILAKQHQLIPSASDVLRELLVNGFRLNESLISDALRRTVGEEWRSNEEGEER